MTLELAAIGIGMTMIGTGIGAAIAEASIGAAAMGAIAEEPKLFGQALLMTIIPETIVVFGLVVSLMMLFL